MTSYIKGYYSKHNLNYWKRGEYLGVGVGASSFINNRRFTNTESIDEYIKALRTEAKKASGMSDAEAQRTIDLEDREAAVSAAEAKQQEAEQEKNATDERVRNDLDLFGKLYPDIFEQVKRDRTVIPKEVWDEAYNGGSLVVAYKKYADAQAAAEKAQILARVAAAEQGAKNAARSTGSMKSAGNDTKNTDPFLSDWD